MSSDNPLEELSRAQVFDSYERALTSLAEDIADEVNNSRDAVDGREWCEENNVPETAFADAVNRRMVNVTYGVSPMYPFNVDDDDAEAVPVQNDDHVEVSDEEEVTEEEVDDGSESDEE